MMTYCPICGGTAVLPGQPKIHTSDCPNRAHNSGTLVVTTTGSAVDEHAIRQRALADALAAVEEAKKDMPDFSGHMFGEYFKYGNDEAAAAIRRLMEKK